MKVYNHRGQLVTPVMDSQATPGPVMTASNQQLSPMFAVEQGAQEPIVIARVKTRLTRRDECGEQ